MRVILEGHQELADVILSGDEQEDVIHDPVVIGVRGDVRALVRVRPEIEQFRNPQGDERFRPEAEGARGLLLLEHDLPVVIAQGDQLLVVVDVEERFSRSPRNLSGQVGDQVVAVQMNLVGHVADLVALGQSVLHRGVAGNSQERRQHIEVSDHLVGHAAWLDLARPAEHRRHPVGAFPVRVLLAAERRHGSIRPGVHVRAVVGAVHDEGVVCDAQVVEHLEHRADVLVVIDHRVVIRALPPPRLADALRLDMRAEMHVGEVHPDKGGFAGPVLPLDEVHGPGGDVVVNRFHPLLGQRTGVLADLLADLAEARIRRRIVGR